MYAYRKVVRNHLLIEDQVVVRTGLETQHAIRVLAASRLSERLNHIISCTDANLPVTTILNANQVLHLHLRQRLNPPLCPLCQYQHLPQSRQVHQPPPAPRQAPDQARHSKAATTGSAESQPPTSTNTSKRTLSTRRAPPSSATTQQQASSKSSVASWSNSSLRPANLLSFFTLWYLRSARSTECRSLSASRRARTRMVRLRGVAMISSGVFLASIGRIRVRGMCALGRSCISTSGIICIRHRAGARIRLCIIITIRRRTTRAYMHVCHVDEEAWTAE